MFSGSFRVKFRQFGVKIVFDMGVFKINHEFKPAGDQPDAIERLDTALRECRAGGIMPVLARDGERTTGTQTPTTGAWSSITGGSSRG